jgi:NADPH-dependent 2,4-dienoyl-CoA reductase/sulfur reductase-like enzyme
MHHVIIGAGPAGVIAAETLRRTDASARITLVGDEPEKPYSRMAIPYLLAENIAEEGTHLRHGQGHYETRGVEVRAGRASAVDPAARTVTLSDGGSLRYDRLLVASGSHTVRPPIEGASLSRIENCWTLADARRIMAQAQAGSRVVLMGAGFIGCIVLEALVSRGVDLTVVELEDRMLARMMDDAGAGMIKRWCEGKGVRVLTSTRVTGLEDAGSQVRLKLDGAPSVTADLVVCATGVAPNVDFLKGSGVAIDAGVLVDERLRTNVEGIYAAGDVAQGPAFPTGTKEVHAIQPTASEHGRIAARNMAGHDTPYRGSLSMNVLNTLGLVSSSFGAWMGVDGGERAIVSDPDRFKYLRLEFDGDRVVGALAIGLTQHVGVIRGLVQTQVPLGSWKGALCRDPHRVMDAYLDRTQASAA